MTKKQYFILTLAFAIGWLFVSFTFGQITGPIQTQIGTLAVFETTQKACWSVSPTSKSSGMFFADSSGTRLYFASPLAGEYEVVAATIENGEPKLYTFPFVNGDGVLPPNPQPKPEPEPETFADWLKACIPDSSTVLDQNRIAEIFAKTSANICQGTIVSSDQAFASIRINAQRYSLWRNFLEKLSERDELKTGDLKELGKVFDEIASAIREAEKSIPASPSTAISEDCPDGNCQLPTPNSKLPTYRRRW